jgi:hypothetical protein
MGRSPKEGVDYFPHKAKHGETMFILERQFGNDGYSAWFKILESLAAKEGHFLDCHNGKPTWEYLKAKTNLDDEKLLSVINLLAKLDAIDSELWSIKVIWSQHFCDGIADVYKKRKANMPQKPSFCDRNPGFRDRNDSSAVISVTESTQRERGSKEREYIHIDFRGFLGQFQNVKLSQDEHQKLITQFGEKGTNQRIDNLSAYIASKGKKYKSHYATILTWERRNPHGNERLDQRDDENIFLSLPDDPGDKP